MTQMPQKLDGSFIRGYTRAITDVTEVFSGVAYDMGRRKKRSLSFGQIGEIMKIILENRERIREKDSGFVRWNAAKKNFEFYRPEV